MSFIPETVSLEKLAGLLGVDELQVIRSPFDPDMIVRIRLGERWLSANVDYTAIKSADIGRILYDLADNLKRSMLTGASGVALDQMASLVGVMRDPELQRPMNRFEAVVAELKKL
jgi:hypothetical protein